MFTREQKKRLIAIARNSINEIISNKKVLQVEENDPVLMQRRGAFVTIKIDGRLRGCIGRIIGDVPLAKIINEMAVEAATSDPRFPALTPEELEKIELEISVLSPLKKIDDIKEIKVGVHGLIIRKAFFSGLLLPQVAAEYKWTREEFLQQTCLKAGLPKDAWKDNAEIYIFSADVFSEDSI